MAGQKRRTKAKKTAASKKTFISAVFSFRNEEDVLAELIERVSAVLKGQSLDFELIFVNDDSTDGSLELLTEKAAKDKRIKVITMSRRFGVSECLLAGIAHASGDAVLYMDADLQDPPEVIPEMIAKWRDGADVVYTVRTQREGENALKMWITRQAYRTINAASEIDMPVNAGDFRLLSRRAYQGLMELGEMDPYPRGLIPWLGFRQEPVYYQRHARAGGDPHFSLLNSLGPYKTFISGLTSFSMAPIFLIVLAGALATLFSVAGLFFAWITGAGGMAWVMFLIFLWGSLLFCLGFVGIYVGRTYKDIRGRPRHIIKDTIGFDG